MFAGQLIDGGIVSATIILAVQELDAPRLSTTVSVTRFVPFGYGPAGLSRRFTIVPSGSNEPLSTAAGFTVASQLATAFVVTFRHCATGGVFVCVTVTVNEQLLVLPEVSVAVQFTTVTPTGKSEPEAGVQLVETM